MAEEEVVVVSASPKPSDHKRKLEELEPEQESVLEQPPKSSGELADSNAEPDAANELDASPPSDESDAKRPRLDDKSDDIARANGHQEKLDDTPKENDEEEVVPGPAFVDLTETQIAPSQPGFVDLTETATNEQHFGTNGETSDIQKPSVEDSVVDAAQEPPQEEPQPHSAEEGDSVPAQPEQGDALSGQPEKTDTLPVNQEQGDTFSGQQEQGDAFSAQQDQLPENEAITHRMEVPNNKVGVLIGKAGDTIRYLQYNSRAKIQITKDADADPYSATRPVEITGSLDSVTKAEKLINAVIAEADAGGSPSLVARGVATAQAVAAAEQIQIQVPNEKVGLIIGRMGDTIKSLQAKTGARIQLIPQHLPKGDESKERTVRVSGDKKQIDMARELIKEVMNQTVRPSSGFNHQAYRSHGPGGPQWGPRGARPSQHSSYDYQQRGPYQSRTQYPPAYGNYPQHMGPRSGFGSGWEQRPPPNMQGMPPHGGGYDYYGGQGAEAPAQHSTHGPSHAPGPSPNPIMGGPPSQANYNYGQPHGSDYRHPAPFSHAAPPQHGYGHGYEEPKYDNHAPPQHSYGGHGASQPYPQTGAHPGYGPQQHYGKPPAYTMPSQGPPPQSYGAPMGSQPGEAVYQTPAQSYGQNVPAQQPYPYASTAPAQQTYAPYGSAPAADGYTQPPTASSAGYPQQGGQPASYGQPGSQPAPGYAQAAPAGYAQYPTSQQGYSEQSASYAGGYGYQASQDPAYGGVSAPAYGGAPAAQQGYAQPAPAAAGAQQGYTQPAPATTQQSYDQSIPQSGGYGKTVSPQPGYAQYDSSQMYAAPR
ncbi:putative K domain-containing protein [Rosa chinensis]|uniref:Putative K domain-containing protein n=1 Tax=Rosa chinensis TaxID=74649 RepID=A0A2P6Q081_ROSCH|nr:flowering locus K homology domain [Rosa chinensis]PRQ27591.1 putative K domain-containing protein [Rosa chinensis]